MEDFADLIPVFVEEARDRLERLATRASKVDEDETAVVESRRELHTLKGAGRMLQLSAVAELCHAAEELLHAPTTGQRSNLMVRVVDRLAHMVDEVSHGRLPAADSELLSLLAAASEESEASGNAKPAKGARSGGASPAGSAKAAQPKTRSKSARSKAAGAKTERPKSEKAPAGGRKAAASTAAASTAGPAIASPSTASKRKASEPKPDKPRTNKPKTSKPTASIRSAVGGKVSGAAEAQAARAGGGSRKGQRGAEDAAEAATQLRAASVTGSPGRAEEARGGETPHGPAEAGRGGDDKGAAAASGASPQGRSTDIRIDAAALDEVADHSTQMRIMALSSFRLTDRIYELARLAEESLHDEKPTQVLAVLATMLRRVAVEIEGGQRRMTLAAEAQLDTLLTLQLQPLRGSLHSLARYARDLARSLGRDEVEVETAGEETRLDRRITRELEDSLLHLVRNAVDHGIEPPHEREASGKPRAGHLRLAASADGARVRLRIEDDGAGIDPDAVLERAIRMELMSPEAAKTLSRQEIFRLLFLPGFSTRYQVSEISGRGVGLDVVATSVARVGGEVFLDSQIGKGTQITVEVPIARRGEQVLLLRVGQLRLAVPSDAIRRVETFSAEAVVERGGRTLVRLGDRLVPFVSLSRAYGEPPEETQLLLEGEISGLPLAVSADAVDGEEEVLVRPFPAAVSADRLLEGMALLASGEPVGVLSPSMLARREYLRSGPAAPMRAQVRPVRVLLVDDSLVTREMERRLLEDAGFLVIAAGDGEEALSCLGEEDFDCVVTDIEMPGMDGFELTAHIRGIEHLAQLPIIVVSTRDRPEDRLRGLKSGADAYLTKQSLDAGELVDLVRRLGGR